MCFYVQLENFSLIRSCHHNQCKAANVYLYIQHLWPLSIENFLACQTCDTGHPFRCIMVSPMTRDTHICIPAFSSVYYRPSYHRYAYPYDHYFSQKCMQTDGSYHFRFFKIIYVVKSIYKTYRSNATMTAYIC